MGDQRKRVMVLLAERGPPCALSPQGRRSRVHVCDPPRSRAGRHTLDPVLDLRSGPDNRPLSLHLRPLLLLGLPQCASPAHSPAHSFFRCHLTTSFRAALDLALRHRDPLSLPLTPSTLPSPTLRVPLSLTACPP
eukprot:1153881-Rhodomonas_salina.1